jgi:hypothetical protein
MVGLFKKDIISLLPYKQVAVLKQEVLSVEKINKSS